MKLSIAAALVLAVAGTPPALAAPAHFSAAAPVRIGQVVRLGNLRVRPDRIVEDSRCPRMVSCVWRGRLRITAEVAGKGRLTLDNGVPVNVLGGRLTLITATPISQHGEQFAPEDYLLTLRYER